MKVKFKTDLIIEDISREQFFNLLFNKFKSVCDTKESTIIFIGRSKYISINYKSKKKCNCYISLHSIYPMKDYTMESFINTVINDPYIIRNFKENLNNE